MKGTGITPKVRKIVLERDSIDGWPCCIKCGQTSNIELAHYVSRARGGKGIPENLVCLCNRCHKDLDNGSNIGLTREIKATVEDHLRACYDGWDLMDLGGRK